MTIHGRLRRYTHGRQRQPDRRSGPLGAGLRQRRPRLQPEHAVLRRRDRLPGRRYLRRRPLRLNLVCPGACLGDPPWPGDDRPLRRLPLGVAPASAGLRTGKRRGNPRSVTRCRGISRRDPARIAERNSDLRLKYSQRPSATAHFTCRIPGLPAPSLKRSSIGQRYTAHRLATVDLSAASVL